MIQARLSVAQTMKLQRLAEAAANDEAFCVRHTEAFHPSHFGALGYAWMSSSSLRSAFNKMHRYSRLLSHTWTFSIEESKGLSRIQFDWETGQTRAPSQHFGTMSVMVHLSRQIAGPEFSPLRIGFVPPRPGSLEVFESQFRAPLSFGQRVNFLEVSERDMDRPLPMAQADIAALHDDLILRYLANLDRRDTVGQVRAAISELLPEGEVTASRVAQKVNISVRTLRRRLQEQDLTFRELLAEMRREQCDRYLADTTMSLTEIAYLLGFSSPSAFSRAYRSWTGKPPAASRRRLAAGG